MAPPQRIRRCAKSRLSDAIADGNNTVSRLYFCVRKTQRSVLPMRRSHFLVRQRLYCSLANKQERRVVHFNNFSLAVCTAIHNCKCGITDLTHLAHGQGVHHDLCGMEEVHFTGGKLYCHGGSHSGKNIGFNAATQTVG